MGLSLFLHLTRVSDLTFFPQTLQSCLALKGGPSPPPWKPEMPGSLRMAWDCGTACRPPIVFMTCDLPVSFIYFKILFILFGCTGS